MIPGARELLFLGRIMFGADELLTIAYVALGFGAGCFVALYTLGRMLHER